jgi:hypothetical protein
VDLGSSVGWVEVGTRGHGRRRSGGDVERRRGGGDGCLQCCAKERESPRNAAGGGRIFNLQHLMQKLLEGEIVTSIPHFEDAAHDEERAGDRLSGLLHVGLQICCWRRSE